MKKVVIAICVVFFVLGYGVGYMVGYAAALDWAFKKAQHFTSIEIDEKLLREVMIKYKNGVDVCWPS